MSDKPIILKSGEEKSRLQTKGKLFRLMVKTKNLEAIIAEIDSHTASRWYQHDGEELHYILEGEIIYEVGEESYKMSKGQLLWHKSTVRHRAINNSNKKAKYATVGTPPTFIIE
jgi:quercetin dioxygenase-like cupin family protein